MFMEFLQVIGSFALGMLLYVVAEASKYIFAGEFNLRILWKTNLEPAIWTLMGGVIIAAITFFIPQATPFIEAQIGTKINLDASSLILTGTIIGGLIKGLVEKNRAKQKVAIVGGGGHK